jgi:hypothetical protein
MTKMMAQNVRRREKPIHLVKFGHILEHVPYFLIVLVGATGLVRASRCVGCVVWAHNHLFSSFSDLEKT